jgi:hypothetical protein
MKQLGVPVARKGSCLVDRTGAGLESELAVDRKERHGEDDPADCCPEPLRARSDERHPVGVDELHVRFPPFCCHRLADDRERGMVLQDVGRSARARPLWTVWAGDRTPLSVSVRQCHPVSG